MSISLSKSILQGTIAELQSDLEQFEGNICAEIDILGYSLLHICVINSKVEEMRIMLQFAQRYSKPEYYSWLEHQTKEGLTALLMAVSKGQIDAVKVLIEFGANIYCKNSSGLDVVHLCAQGNYAEILVYFNEISVMLSNTDNKGGTPLHWAAYMGSFNVLSLLISLRVNKNIRDSEGRTPLHLGVMAGNEKVVRKLIISGANTEIKDKKNRTPLAMARESNFRNIRKMLSPPTVMQKLGCQPKLSKPIRSNQKMAVVLAFLCFSFIFIIFFCAKSNIYIGDNIGTYLLIGIVVVIIVNMIYLIASDPGYIALPKSVSLQELYKTSASEICTECKIVRPPRSRHCYYCRRCIYRYDHHCQWINNCVGINNNNPFFFFLFSLLVLCGIVDYIAIDVFLYPKHDGFIQGTFSLAAAVMIILISSLVIYPVFLLFMVQVKNFSYNMTSNERLSKNNKKLTRKGFWLTNWVRMCSEKRQDKL